MRPVITQPKQLQCASCVLDRASTTLANSTDGRSAEYPMKGASVLLAARSHAPIVCVISDWHHNQGCSGRHANVSTTRLYDRRKSKPEDSPTFHVKY